MKRTTAVLLCVALFCYVALAQDKQSSTSPRTIHLAQSAVHVPAPDEPVGLKKIYSNLGPKNDQYNSFAAFVVEGPNNAHPTQFVGMPFTPKSNATVTQVRVAVQYISGANQVNLSLYADGGGIPGTLLAGPVTITGIASSGGCCSLTIATFGQGVPVVAGTRYWVVADTPLSGTGSDFKGTWDFIFRTNLNALSSGGSFHAFNGPDTEAAGAVYGTIP